MSKGVIIHLDNDHKGVLAPSKHLFDQYGKEHGLEVDYIICQTRKEFEDNVKSNRSNLKALIFDLLSQEPSAKEIEKQDSVFLEELEEKFAQYNIPIFIYSGFLDALGGKFDNYGTVFKLDKGQSIVLIFDKFKFFHDSGFIDVFCPGGIIENEIKNELHGAFINQFDKITQIEEVIKSILSSESPASKSERVKTVFKRIAIKTLASDLLAPIADSEDAVNPIEHFYKRQSKLEIWTGDIWKNKKNDINVVVLTPRCDFATGKAENLLFCIIEKPSPIKLTGKQEEVEKNLRNHLTDNLSAKSKRYIPSTVFFPQGGMVNLGYHTTIGKNEFLSTFDYIVTLSDDLTNEIIGKFAYYFLRTGITNINELEFQAILKLLNTQNGKK